MTLPRVGFKPVHRLKPKKHRIEKHTSESHAGTWVDEKIGRDIVRKALEEPLCPIANKAGFERLRLQRNPHQHRNDAPAEMRGPFLLQTMACGCGPMKRRKGRS